VYLKVGNEWRGPYYVAEVVRSGVYTLCDQDGNEENGGDEVSEASLRRA
jgi:hypothetical protein